MDASKGPWRGLWEDIGRTILSPGWVDYLIVKHGGKYKDRDTGKEYEHMDDRLVLIQTKCIGKYKFLESLRQFESDGYKDRDSQDRVDYQIKAYQVARTSSNVFPVIACSELSGQGKIGGTNASWLKTFQDTYSGMTAMESFFETTRPVALLGTIIKMLDCYETTGGCNLNYNNSAWRGLWENLAGFLNSPEWVKEQIDREDINMKETHLEMMKTCVGYYKPLAFIAALDPDFPFRDISFPNISVNDMPSLDGSRGYVNEYDTKIAWPGIGDAQGHHPGAKELVRRIT